jgi:hypothetical protein
VRDEQHRSAVGREVAHHREQDLDLLRGERRRRLVEDEHRGAPHQCSQDRHSLLLADGQVAHARQRVEPEPVPLDQPGRLGGERPDARDPGRAVPAEEQVLGDAEALDELVVLVDHADAMPHGLLRRGRPVGAPVDLHRAGVRRQDAGDDLHQGGLARAVLSEDRVDLAGVAVEIDAAHRLEQPEGLPQPPQLQLGGARTVPCPYRHRALTIGASHVLVAVSTSRSSR